MAIPKISVIIPVYNTDKFLQRCVDSLTAQTLKEIEIILVDDGSGESCALLCDELAKQDPRIQVIHKQNAGPGYARNTGLEIASGQYIGFVDSDDDIEPVMYEKLYEAAEKYQADLVLSGVCFVGGNTFENAGAIEKKSYFESDNVFEANDMKQLLLGIVGALPHESDDSRYGVSVWKNLFRHDLIRQENLTFLSERIYLSEDTLFMVDFVKRAKKAVGIPGAYYRYWRNDESFSKSYRADRFDKSLVFLTELQAHVQDAVSKEEYKIYLDRLTQSWARVICSQEIMHAKEHKIPYSSLRKRLKTICTHEKIQQALQTYPWHRLPIKQAAFAFAMKYRLYLLQKVMVLLRAR